MATFDAKSVHPENVHSAHNVLVDQLNKWVPTLNADTLDSLHSTDFVRSTTIMYEESTWLPVLAGGTQAGTITISTDSTGRYIRNGHSINIYCTVRVTSITGSSGSIAITGFPYAAVGNGQHLSCATNGVNWGTGATAPVMLFGASTNRGNIYGQLNNGAWVAANISGLSTSDEIKIQGTYIMST